MQACQSARHASMIHNPEHLHRMESSPLPTAWSSRTEATSLGDCHPTESHQTCDTWSSMGGSPALPQEASAGRLLPTCASGTASTHAAAGSLAAWVAPALWGGRRRESHNVSMTGMPPRALPLPCDDGAASCTSCMSCARNWARYRMACACEVAFHGVEEAKGSHAVY